VDVARVYEQAHQTPGKRAVVCNGVPSTYDEFARWIEGARQYLAQQDLPVASVAVVCTESLIDEWVIGLALRSLGLTTVAAIDAEGMRKLKLRNIDCIVTTTAAADQLVAAGLAADSRSRVIRVPAHIRLAVARDSVLNTPVSMTRPGGHILLTSGTTGAYKKVLWGATTQALAIPLHAEINGISSQSIVYVANFGLWTAAGYRWPLSTWTMGGTVVIHQAPDLHHPLTQHDLSHIFTTPDQLSALMRASKGSLRRNDATRLMVAGAAMPKEMLLAAKQHLTRQVYSVLASTEGMTLSVTPIEQPEDLLWHRIHPSREVQVVDEADNVLGPGHVGLVRIRIIDGLEGYLDDDEATRTFFRDGYFYSGDLGLFSDDGRLSLRGRASDVINILGNKIATSPIERALQDRLGAEGVCIVSIQRNAGVEEIHLVVQSSRRIERAEFEAATNAELGMIRRMRVHVSFMEKLPRNEMGKIQRLALKQQLMLAHSASP
jgi:acyl-coenzyme A synthetase/AMP-(fatty) acid ligase